VKPIDIDRFDRAMWRLFGPRLTVRAPDAGAIAAADAALRIALQALRGDAAPVRDTADDATTHTRRADEPGTSL
jgi:hypothetical protein